MPGAGRFVAEDVHIDTSAGQWVGLYPKTGRSHYRNMNEEWVEGTRCKQDHSTVGTSTLHARFVIRLKALGRQINPVNGFAVVPTLN